MQVCIYVCLHLGMRVCMHTDMHVCVRMCMCVCTSNEEVHPKIQQATGPNEDLLTIVKRRKLQWYGHISRSLGLAETILKGAVKGLSLIHI